MSPLTDDAGATVLKYEVNAQVGGKLAQLGARLIDATAKQMAEQFFTKFSDEVQKLGGPAPASVEPETPGAGAPTVVETRVAPEPSMTAAMPPSAVGILDLVPREPFGLPVMGWVGIGMFVVLVVLWLGSILS